MNVKELKEFLANFQDDSIVGTEANNHVNNDGITYATLLEWDVTKVIVIKIKIA